jgi:hypothetical protein
MFQNMPWLVNYEKEAIGHCAQASVLFLARRKQPLAGS